MTAITPLEFIHKKGLFGNHHKKNESDLLKISELKNLSIIQVMKYQRSKAQMNDIKIDNLEFPLESCQVKSNQNTRILWNAPNVWILISDKENIINQIKTKCDEENFAVTDISHSRTAIQIQGLQAREVLKKGCPINLNKIKKNECAGTVFNGITIIIDLVDDNPDIFYIFTLRSFGESFYHHITDSSLEFGYEGI